MSFTLLSGLTPTVVVLVALVAATVLTLGVVLVDFVARNRTVRLRRHEGVRQYYGHLVLGH